MAHTEHHDSGGHGDSEGIFGWDEVMDVMDKLNPEHLTEAMGDVADEVGAGQKAAQGIVEASATAMLGPAFTEGGSGGDGGKKAGGHH